MAQETFCVVQSSPSIASVHVFVVAHGNKQEVPDPCECRTHEVHMKSLQNLHEFAFRPQTGCGSIDRYTLQARQGSCSGFSGKGHRADRTHPCGTHRSVSGDCCLCVPPVTLGVFLLTAVQAFGLNNLCDNCAPLCNTKSDLRPISDPPPWLLGILLDGSAS